MDDVAPTSLTPSRPPPASLAAQMPVPVLPKAPELPAPATEQPRRKLRPFMILGVVLLLAAAGGGVYVGLHAGKESTDDAQVEADVVALAPRVSGRIARVLVQDNQAVKAGDVVLALEDADFAARVQKAEAELAIAQAELRAAEAQEQIA